MFTVRTNSRQELTMSEEKGLRGKNAQDQLYLMLRLLVYITCIVFFVINSYAIFRDFMSNPTIISTKVVKSPNKLLEFPSFLICNESSFKNPTLLTDYEGYKNNTMSLDDFLVEMKFGRDLGRAVLEGKLKSIKGTVQEVLTAFHGACFLSQEHTPVRS